MGFCCDGLACGGIHAASTLNSIRLFKRIEHITQTTSHNLFDACDLKMQWDLIVSNPPYIREDEFDGLPRDVRMYEPKEALIAGPRGVEVIERLARESVTRLLCGGWLLIEIGPPEESEQAVDACLHLKRHPTLLDLADIPRVIHAQMQ